nr:MAG TPA: hypothetical protein [Caudoviricetes sp.]
MGIFHAYYKDADSFGKTNKSPLKNLGKTLKLIFIT